MLLLGDRNFPSWKLWGQSTATGAHLLWRAKASLLPPRLGVFADGSWLAVLPKPRTGRRFGHWVRVIEYSVTVTATDPRTGQATTRTELFRLLTTITTRTRPAPPTWPPATGNDGNQKPATRRSGP